MIKKAQQAILLKEDVVLLRDFFKKQAMLQVSERQNFEKLSEEISQAVVVEKPVFPEDVVRLNSAVRIRDEDTKTVLDIQLVLPEQADIKKGKLSVLAPLGTALIGFREGQDISWKMPAGMRHFTIVKVQQPAGREENCPIN